MWTELRLHGGGIMEGMAAGVRCRGSLTLTLTLLVCGLPTISLAADTAVSHNNRDFSASTCH